MVKQNRSLVKSEKWVTKMFKFSPMQLINTKIIILILLLVGGSFTQQKLWPFVPFDMYCKEKAEIKKNYWFKIITPNKSFFVRAEKTVFAPKRFFFKANLLKLKELKTSNPKRVQEIADLFRDRIARKRGIELKLEIYEERFHYKDEKFVNREMELLGASR